jgi:putative hemolysin
MPNSGLLAGQSQTGSPVQRPNLFPFRGWVQRLLPMQRIEEIYRRAQQPVNRSLLENVLSEMRVRYQVADSDVSRIPTTGPVIVTSNHPFGILDGAIVGALLTRVREDVKVMTNFLLAGIPELREHCIFVDPFGSPESASLNRRALVQAIEWLRGGGMLAMFPAGEVSHIQFPQMQIADPEWNATAVRLACMANASTVPLFVRGRNSVPFQAMGLLHPRLRTAWLLNEFLQQTNRTIEVRVGNSISAETLRDIGEHKDAANYLRWRSYLLGQRGRTRKQIAPAIRTVLPRKAHASIAQPVARELLLRDLEHLAPENCLDQNREFAVYLAGSSEIPHMMQELGRLREVTFRAAGEGTGQSADLDRFDSSYKHLLLWSKSSQELVGGYRMGLTSEILPRSGPNGLYTSTLFRYDARVFDRLGPALELGRSFVRLEYQRQYAPLLMLWKGIGRYLATRPELAVLFGAVSISSRYNQVSRELIVRFFQARESGHELAHWVTPRRPFRQAWVRSKEYDAACDRIKDLDELSGPISDIETDGKGLPILLKQYAKLGGRIVNFNVDRNFSDVLDGLVLVDLRQTDATVLERYMGKAGAETFRQYHRCDAAVPVR